MQQEFVDMMHVSVDDRIRVNPNFFYIMVTPMRVIQEIRNTCWIRLHGIRTRLGTLTDPAQVTIWDLRLACNCQPSYQIVMYTNLYINKYRLEGANYLNHCLLLCARAVQLR